MKTHFDHISEIVPDLSRGYVLDLGSGRGKFLIELALRGVKAVGLELNPAYIEISHKRAKEKNVSINVDRGVGENLPYQDSTFNFVNMGEVIEHVADIYAVMNEVYRVLQKGGSVYISVPNRFGLRDQHFNLYFVNWMPRAWSNTFISIFSKHKDYNKTAGLQRLDEMHYMTFSSAKKFFSGIGFEARDIREIKINKRFTGFKRHLVNLAYHSLRPWFFDSFHFLLIKEI